MEGDEIIPTVSKSTNPSENRCPVCKEDFIEVYKDENPDDDDDIGLYHLENAVRPQGPGSSAYHPECYEQYLISLDQNNSEKYFLECPHQGDSKTIRLSSRTFS